MSVEKKFVAEGISKALVNEYLAEELERAGYGGMVMNRTPMGTQITVYAEKPGMVIGKGGKLIRKITRDLDRRFHLDNPQIDVQDVGRGDLNGRVVANRLASSLERGWYFRKAGQSMMKGHGRRCSGLRDRHQRQADRTALQNGEVHLRVHQALRQAGRGSGG